jgi:hypothetical protein
LLVRASTALLIALLLAGCGGSAVPEGTPISVRFEVVPSVGLVGPHGVVPQPLTVDMTASEWRRVSRLLPDPLPEPVDQGSDCDSGHVVSVRLAAHDAISGEVEYGPCRLPKAIEPVRLLMQTLLKRRVAAERRCKCP